MNTIELEASGHDMQDDMADHAVSLKTAAHCGLTYQGRHVELRTTAYPDSESMPLAPAEAATHYGMDAGDEWQSADREVLAWMASVALKALCVFAVLLIVTQLGLAFGFWLTRMP